MKALALLIPVTVCGSLAAYADPRVELSEGMTPPVPGARVVTFDDRKSARYAGAGQIVVGSSPSSTQPEGDETPYFSVKPTTAAFVAEPGVSFNYFGLYWGTIDAYNELHFFKEGRLIATLTGRDVLRLISAHSTAGLPSSYVNIYFDSKSYNRIEFKTSIPAFESDNHAFSNVRTSEADAM